MRHYGLFATLSLACALASARAAEEEFQFPKPGPEHAHLKAQEGAWDATMTMPDGTKSKGQQTYKMEFGGLWLTSEYRGEFGGLEFQGKGMDTFDAAKKKYVSVWVDSMSTTPMLLEGDRDEKTHTLTMRGESAGPDGKPQKVKIVTKMPDADHMNMEFFMVGADGQETSGFKIDYARRKK